MMLAPQVGTLLAGRYALLQSIGRGGMGEVFCALDHETRQRVAVKVLLEGSVVDIPGLRRFEREVAALRAVGDAGIVQVLDYRAERSEPVFFVMDLLEGHTARQVLAEQGGLPWRTATRLVCAVLRTLAAVHGAGLVHRDIKPSNLFLCSNGAVRLLDFGIAKRYLADESVLTREGEAVGTPGYMAPEQLLGGAVSPAIDLYAVGVTLFELVAARRPYQDASAQLRALAHQEPAPRLDELVRHVPTDLAELVASSLAREPAQRPPSAEAFRFALESMLQRTSPEVLDATTAPDAPTWGGEPQTRTLALPHARGTAALPPVRPSAPIAPSVVGPISPLHPNAPAFPIAAALESPASAMSPSRRGSRWIGRVAALAVGACLALLGLYLTWMFWLRG